MSEPLVVDARVTIPGDELSLEFSRASGPGGQHVNKTETRATLRWRPAESKALTEAQRARVARRLAPRLTLEGELLISADGFRSRARNIDDARARLRELLIAALAVPKRRVKTKPSAGAKRRRLAEKKKQSERKEGRRRPGGDD